VPRKNTAALLRSVTPVLAAHPDVLLVLHCATMTRRHPRRARQPVPGAFETGPGAGAPADRHDAGARHVPRLSDADLNVMYNAADVYTSPTMAEGFGLCLVEALAANVPVVTTTTPRGGGLRTRRDRVPVAGYLTTSTPTSGRWSTSLPSRLPSSTRQSPRSACRTLGSGPPTRRRYTWDAAADAFDGILRTAPQGRIARRLSW